MASVSDNLFSWSNLAGAVAIYYGTVIFYRLFLHPLAGFPGPKLAAISRWYEGYYDLVLGGQYTLKIRELHGYYGVNTSFLHQVMLIWRLTLGSCRPDHSH